jgi:hypothetical protein
LIEQRTQGGVAASIPRTAEDAGSESTGRTADAEMIPFVVSVYQSDQVGETPPKLERNSEQGPDGRRAQ